MSIENFKLNAKLKQEIDKCIAEFIMDGIVAGIEPEHSNYQIHFCMAIQFIPRFAKGVFSFGKPEGIRVFISKGETIAAAFDFVFSRQEVKFSHIYQGIPLDQLVNTIKKIKRMYAKSDGNAYVELIQYYYTRHQYVLVKEGRKRAFYRNAGNTLEKVTLQELKNEIKPILKYPPMFENN